MVGEKLQSGRRIYTILRPLAELGRPNANVYYAEDENNEPFVVKHFYNQNPMSNIALGVKNHFGRRRDGSELVFNEIVEKANTHDFIVKHLDRFKYKDKWVIIIEYVDGELLGNFIRSNYLTRFNEVSMAIKSLAETLITWHRNGFAHGDPHLNNAIVQTKNDFRVKLIDYSQIHNKDFKYCKKYKCFSPDPSRRLLEDLENDFGGKIGEGFRADLLEIEKEFNLSVSLSEIFDDNYCLR